MQLRELYEDAQAREIYANDYVDLAHLRSNIETFIEVYYNRCRLHSALYYQPPEEFEQQLESTAINAGATMSFSGMGRTNPPYALGSVRMMKFMTDAFGAKKTRLVLG